MKQIRIEFILTRFRRRLMRMMLAILLTLIALNAVGDDFKIKAARDAISQSQRDIKQARLECAKSLEAAAQAAVEKNEIQEMIA